ncbi:S1C family serine protease [Anaerotardibacter muris]|uniref:S1C family serine protease n=1 Tax=Anaerotardibacter muris TaxID=2941505 RepID=UPI00203F1807|nr:trypsin-like peptidase domain-containing protein [Anaerotardibacter muris]
MTNPQQPSQPQPPTGQPVQPGAPAPQPAPQATPQPQPQAQQPAAAQQVPAGAQPASNTSTNTPGTTVASAPAAAKPKKPRTNLRTFLFAFAGAAVACIIAFGGNALINGGNSGYTIQETNSGIVINANTDDMTLAEAVAAKTLPSVVNINVYANTAAQGFSPFANQAQTLEQTSLGSGVVLTADGYILTNNHVVDGADALEVVAEGETYEAKIVGTDPSSDLAVVKVDGATLKPIEIGNSSELVVGEWVMAAGSPFGMEQSVSTGIVSAVNRSYADEESGAIYTNMIQTDAAINSGNSGGALVDAEGKLIGINTLIMSTSGTSSGVGFAIPVDYAFGIAEQIIQGKTPSHAQMGVSMITVNDQIASRFGLSTDEGAYINSITANGPAAKAGLQEGDVIVKVDGETITGASDLVLAVRSHNPGDKVSVTYIRDGKEATAEVTLGSDS